MMVTVEGVITSVEEKTKDDKPYTELLLAQKGEKMQVTVRVPGAKSNDYEPFQVETFQGRLMQWATRNGVGSMVMVDGN
ncbi:hypothetical protein [Paenibacillus sp. 453mf]|uniref:hypothetical protein n=1 Tax=Paenibacillus sp. 453mf TaxID=1761874 RepID=UPI0008F2AF2E|nr:hypothetical protein [Paenibacillus sp. 453mf]SFT00913.1 hypothetical protein SAMN04488601_12110 [Paenibacillus sp. 453mf]